MLRNKAFTILQKTYDDSYLSCSTAVYYESQGDELEAMRHWKIALEQIYEHHATKAIPLQGPQTDTEKALVEALRQLELQCKERIDLIEALRVSRQEEAQAALDPWNKYPRAASSEMPTNGQSKPGIGQGSIPAVTYSELSRPSISNTRSSPSRPPPPPPNRPSLPTRTSSEYAVVNSHQASHDPFSSNGAPSNLQSLNVPSKHDKTVRSPSPEKHTMRTTLRSSRPGDKPVKPSRKSPKPAAEGPSKAATLAWSALGSRERQTRQHVAPGPAALSFPAPSPHRSIENLSKPAASQAQWDNHSRRLVTPRETDLSTAAAGAGLHIANQQRQSDELSFSKPSVLSLSAASSAINSQNQEPDSSQTRPERLQAHRSVPSGPIGRASREDASHSLARADDSGESSDKRSASDAPTRKNAIARRTAPAPLSKIDKVSVEKSNRPRRRDQPKPRPTSTSSASGEDREKPRVSNKRVPNPNKRKESDEKQDSVQSSEGSTEEKSLDISWKKKKAALLKNLPPGVDESAAKQILNDIIVQGDEVHWTDIAGLEIAKNALRETVVYPFLRPDLFMGLREPARGMLLFGPPGTGKTMLARAVATESKSTFFSISASSLTSKFLGESEKLVRALFGIARALAPSIIFVDEIDSLLSQRSGSGEHEATRRIKTEFLIQWSDLQRAAAGREASDRDKERGDANRVLVLAATNLPWAIDEAARRRFVRRQYIPLPEPHTRETQLRTLLASQKHSLSASDIQKLIDLTDGFSGSDITALAKDAAMGPLRSLGDALLHMTMDEIRPIALVDFQASLGTIRPSVSKSGLKEYEDWAEQFGERGG